MTMSMNCVVRHLVNITLQAIVLCQLLPQSALYAKTSEEGCTSAAISREGRTKLALIVGVGKFQNPRITPLRGPGKDAERLYNLLTGENGYGFPKENVCVLKDEAATVGRFKEMFQKSLVDRISDKNDIAVIYFSGHGSITRDTNEDEKGSEHDQTLLFYDSRSNRKYDLIDDQLNVMLAQLYNKTSNIIVILDSCNSGTAIKGDSVLTPKFYKELNVPAGVKLDAGIQRPDGSGTYVPKDFPGSVFLSAALDGTSAMDGDDGSIFTNALLEVLSPVGSKALTYEQASYEIRRKVAARSPQYPYFHGDISKVVFGNEERRQPYSLRITSIVPLNLQGPALPGLGRNAELKVYKADAAPGDTMDPMKAKATLIVDATNNISVTAHVAVKGPCKEEIKASDIAILSRPGDRFMRLKVRPRPANASGGVDPARVAAINTEIARNPQISATVEIVPSNQGAQFELGTAPDGRLELRDKQNRIRNVYEKGSTESTLVAKNLGQHARQVALLNLKGEGGKLFQDDKSLVVKLEPVIDQLKDKCVSGEWVQAAPNSLQEIPLCHQYKITVEVSPDVQVPLLIGGAVLFSNGEIIGLKNPLNQSVKGGKSITFDVTFRATPPLDIRERVIVFGTQPTNPIDWGQLTSLVEEGAKAKGVGGRLQRELDRYFRMGSKGGVVVDEGQGDDSAWTMSMLETVVRANPRFQETSTDTKENPNKKEYTIAHFNILPYLPYNTNSSLYKVLRKADSLANISAADGIPYKQHDWSAATDEENLKRGIDCSRSIWYAFTRASMAYNENNRYLTTAEMVSKNGPMKKHFEPCDEQQLQIGDVLVYRDDTQGDGHVVMVIDPQLRIAWGAHGWDGNAKAGLGPSDTGVEYQKIKFKPDWERWDRKNMQLKACWRSRTFASEAKSVADHLGFKALVNSCDKANCGYEL